jgi:hypothetical protein
MYEASPCFRLFLLLLTGFRILFESNVMAIGDKLAFSRYERGLPVRDFG